MGQQGNGVMDAIVLEQFDLLFNLLTTDRLLKR